MSSLDSKGKKKSFTRVMVRFAEKTSMQGVPYINSAKLRVAKIAWAVLLICAIGAMVFHLYYLCNQFFQWPIQTSLELGFNNLQLPAITICNVNVIRQSKLIRSDYGSLKSLRQLVQAVDPTTLDPKSTGTYNGNYSASGNMSPAGRKKRYVESFEKLNLTAGNIEESDDAVSKIEEEFQRLFMENSRTLRVSIGHSIEDMLVSCSFNGQTCSTSNFTLYPTPEYGNCYTIESSSFVSTTSGPENSLKLILYLDSKDYIKGITQGYGARVTIHDPGTIPYPSHQGFYISSGFETDIGLKLVEITRLGKPYGSCEDGTAFENSYQRKYTRQSCQEFCEQSAMINRCNCYDVDVQELFNIAGMTDTKSCNTTAELICQESVEDEMKQKTLQCNCENPCSETQYVHSFSTRQWPTEDYATVLVQSICETPNRTSDCQHLADITDKTELSSNFLKLVIYYEDLNYEKIIENPAIEPAQFASDVGGAIGLWIGLSMLSMFELVQLVFELCDYGCDRCKRNDMEKQQRQKTRRSRYQNQSSHDRDRKHCNGTDYIGDPAYFMHYDYPEYHSDRYDRGRFTFYKGPNSNVGSRF